MRFIRCVFYTQLNAMSVNEIGWKKNSEQKRESDNGLNIVKICADKGIKRGVKFPKILKTTGLDRNSHFFRNLMKSHELERHQLTGSI